MCFMMFSLLSGIIYWSFLLFTCYGLCYLRISIILINLTISNQFQNVMLHPQCYDWVILLMLIICLLMSLSSINMKDCCIYFSVLSSISVYYVWLIVFNFGHVFIRIYYACRLKNLSPPFFSNFSNSLPSSLKHFLKCSLKMTYWFK